MLILALLAFAAVATTPPVALAEKTVERGDRGPTVKKLQRLLGIHADGVFGSGTVRALKRFQRRHDIEADGIAGPGTWRMLKRARAASRRTSSAGGGRTTSSGASVRLLQRKLGIAADGVFGPGTLRAVKRFQKRHGLTADGVVGPATWRALGVRGSHPVLKRRGGSSRAGGRSGLPLRVTRAIRAGNRIQFKPYRLGGGHRSFDDTAYDCSGTVSYVLRGAGALSSPLDSTALMSYGSPGKGRWITIYANRSHTYMVVNGRRFDTSMRGPGGSRWSSKMRSSAGYVVRHPPGL